MIGPTFDDLADLYDALIDWPKRLAHEEPFYRRLFARVGARRVVDVACGVGRHAALFHSWGLEVEAADLSPNMIARARQRCGEPAGLRWVVRGFDQPVSPTTPFDAALCVGNSLALAAGAAMVEQALRQTLAAVRPGGAAVVQVLNLWALPDGPCVWQRAQRATLAGREALVIKGVHRAGSRGYVELLVADLAGAVSLRSDTVPFLGLEAAELTDLARAADAARVDLFGGYQDQPYVREKSADLVMVAWR